MTDFTRVLLDTIDAAERRNAEMYGARPQITGIVNNCGAHQLMTDLLPTGQAQWTGSKSSALTATPLDRLRVYDTELRVIRTDYSPEPAAVVRVVDPYPR